ncbi:MAG: signal peptidase I [Gemmatimonadetes bacterium]|nr:signal peptidase I [Gemmatimonadota bacterium]
MAKGGKKNESAKTGTKEEASEATGRKSGKKDRPPPPERFSKEWFADWGRTLVFAAIIFLVFRTFLLATFVITSGSMEDTLLVGDFLLVNKVSLGSQVPGTALRIPGYAEPKHNDIIVFRADHAPGLDIVKRTVGLPGDTLWMEDAQLFRNGVPVDEPYVIHNPRMADTSDPDMAWQLGYLADTVERSGYQPTRDNWGPLVIPEERYFMLGDNREHSLDSRFWGLVERRKMRGKPLFVYYSYDRNALKPIRFLTAMRPGRIGPSPK